MGLIRKSLLGAGAVAALAVTAVKLWPHGAPAAASGQSPGAAAAAALTGATTCPSQSQAVPLLEKIVSEADAAGRPDDELAQTGGRLLARAVQCQLWIRAQALTYDDRDLTEASLGRRVAAALSFEESRAQYLAASGGVDAQQAAALVGALYTVSFGAAPSGRLLGRAPALIQGFRLEGGGEAALPATYRAKLTQAIVASALKLTQRRAKRTASACSGGLEKLPPQLETLRDDYQYPDSIVKVLAECPRANNKGGVS